MNYDYLSAEEFDLMTDDELDAWEKIKQIKSNQNGTANNREHRDTNEQTTSNVFTSC